MKKIVICILILFTCIFAPTTEVYASNNFALSHVELFNGDRPDIDVTDYDRDDYFDTNCQDLARTLRIGGILILIVKIVLPLVIIAKSTFDIGKIAISGNQGDLQKAGKKLGVSIAAAIVIFFLPTLINTVFSFIGGFEDARTADSKICVACIFDPNSPDCTDYIK